PPRADEVTDLATPAVVLAQDDSRPGDRRNSGRGIVRVGRARPHSRAFDIVAKGTDVRSRQDSTSGRGRRSDAKRPAWIMLTATSDDMAVSRRISGRF